MNQLASTLRLLARPEAWTGAATQLAAALNAAGLSPSIGVVFALLLSRSHLCSERNNGRIFEDKLSG